MHKFFLRRPNVVARRAIDILNIPMNIAHVFLVGVRRKNFAVRLRYLHLKSFFRRVEIVDRIPAPNVVEI